MTVVLAYDPALETYRFPTGHPMRPERFSRAVDLMRQWDLLAEENGADGQTAGSRATVVRPEPATDDDLLLGHTADLIAAVREAGDNPLAADPRYGLGPGDTPAFCGMHEAAALAVGSTLTATRAVLGGTATRAMAPAGGLHHARRDRAAGFCIYNDCVVAIETTTRENPGLRVAYVDIDAHHGDGVQEAFYARDDVLTLSVHESGSYLYPGTGHPSETGEGSGAGCALNVALPPNADDACYREVLERAIAPALRVFAPDLVFLQGGADTYRGDPLTHLALTVAGYSDLVAGIINLAQEICGGRTVMVGGGGYEPYLAVPRMWACAMAHLLDMPVPPVVPESWLGIARKHVPQAGTGTFHEPDKAAPLEATREALRVTDLVLSWLTESHLLLAARLG